MRKAIYIIVLLIVVLAGFASLAGIISDSGPGEYSYTSIRGKEVPIYGRGIYKDMSGDVAVQGIAQDYVTFFAGIPLLIISLFIFSRGILKGKYLLAGILGYFTVTYVFYLAMAMYNYLFLVYAALAGLSFYGLIIILRLFDAANLKSGFSEAMPRRTSGWFLIVNSLLIGLLWLSVVVPPLLSGTGYPPELNHYTTLIVQGLDLAILLPGAFISGFLLLKKKDPGYLYGPAYIIFLALLMTALTAKIIAMSLNGVSAGPAIVVIPAINLFALALVVRILSSVNEEKTANNIKQKRED